MFNQVVAFLSGELGAALIYFSIVILADVLFGAVVGHIWGGGFDLRKLRDFVVTTVGWEHTAAFVGALALMYLRHDPITVAAVTALATLYATTTLPDVYDKVSTLFFKGNLPASKNLAVKKNVA